MNTNPLKPKPARRPITLLIDREDWRTLRQETLDRDTSLVALLEPVIAREARRLRRRRAKEEGTKR